jgi:predicted O-methyltransferase YrrM
VSNRDILPAVAGRAARVVLVRDGAGQRLLKQVWIEAKRHTAPNVRNVRIEEIEGLPDTLVTGGTARYCRLVLAALARVLDCRTVFEIGTYRGDTTWLLAHNLPAARLFTLDLPDQKAADHVALDLTDREQYFTHWDRGVRFAGTPEADRITRLQGDSATFDFAPFQGQLDLVFIDASHSYSYVQSDTEAALRMLSPRGAIVWDDYTYYPGVYSFVNELAPSLDHPVVHILETRLAVYSRSALIA